MCKVQNWSAWLIMNACTALAIEQPAHAHVDHAILHTQNPMRIGSPSTAVLPVVLLSSHLLAAENHATTRRVFSWLPPPVCGALGSFWFETNPEKLAENICAQLFGWMYVFVSLGWMPGRRTADSRSWGCLASEKLPNCFPRCFFVFFWCVVVLSF